jgi:DNA-binding response OmpR family regulator
VGTATVLVVEDDASIGRALTGALRAQGLEVLWATTGADALELAVGNRAQLVLLDLGLPDLDGVEVCRRIRRADPHVPIVILTARHSEVDVVLGLDAGGDDYVTKPFRLAELLARVRAHLRRSTAAAPATPAALTIGDVELDRDARRLRVAGEEVELRAREFDLLAFLMHAPGRVFTREQIYEGVWGFSYLGESKVIDFFVSALRRKLDTSEDGSIIRTLRGVGYTIRR